MGLLFAVGSALVVGFLTGLLALRSAARWQRWCPTCGVTNVCPLGHPDAPPGRPADRPGRSGRRPAGRAGATS